MLDHDKGCLGDVGAPEWTHLMPGQALQFRQPHGAIIEVFGSVAFWTENTSVGCTLDANGDSIMELSYGEGRGTQGSCVRSEPSDDEDMPEDDEEVELSMIFDPDIRN